MVSSYVTYIVDWYLLGVVLYEMLVGIPPYFDKDPNMTKKNILMGRMQMPDGLSDEVIDLLNKLLAR